MQLCRNYIYMHNYYTLTQMETCGAWWNRRLFKVACVFELFHYQHWFFSISSKRLTSTDVCYERVRLDMGGENIKVAEYMWSRQHTGLVEGMIMGRSVWVDRFITKESRDFGEMCIKVVSVYTTTFSLTSKRASFINREFNRAWTVLDITTHPLSSCGNRSPIQLFVSVLFAVHRYTNKTM